MQSKLRYIVLILCMISILTGCGNKMYTSGQDGYSQVTFIDGVSFEIISSVSRNATAITNISEDMMFELNQTYLYKDEGTEYFLFNINSLVYIAQKGTSFHFKDAEDKKDALENNGNICGVWFDCPRKKIQYQESEKNGVYKFITEANAQVAITSNLYNDFTGQLAVIDDGTTEWAIYVGSIGTKFNDLSKETKEAVSYMARSLTLYDAPEVVEEIPAVAMGGEYDQKEDESFETNDTVSGNANTQAETTTEQPDVSESEEQIVDNSNVMSGNSVEITEEEDKQTEIEPESEPEEEKKLTTEETIPEQIQVVEETQPEEVVETAASEEEELQMEKEEQIRPAEGVLNILKKSNQKKLTYEDNKIYTVDVYSMLQIGKKAYATTLSGKENNTAVVQLKEVITGKDAEKLIRKACTNGEVRYQYFAPPEGCNWQVAHYTVDGDGYVNVKLRGMDGENLRFRGIEYSQRTYDIIVSDTEFYSYYAVPNGCKEYTLEMGEGTVDSGSGAISAYYKIEQGE